MVGKVTPRGGESDTSPEEKLIKSVFGDKGRDVKDTSLTLPHGVEGRVINVQVFDRKDIPSLEIGVNKYVKVFIATKKTLEAGDKLAGRHGNKGVISTILNKEDMPFMPDGTPLQMLLSPIRCSISYEYRANSRVTFRLAFDANQRLLRISHI